MNQFLNAFQKKFLLEFGKSELSKYFYWSGGTALSYFYLQHRFSEDLDFLSQDLMPDEYILAQIKNLAEKIRIEKIEQKKEFNRNEFIFKKRNKFLRIEFVYYPFPNLKKLKQVKEFKIKIDSLEDIATNKTYAIFERSEPKDVFDLYWILKKQKIRFLLFFKWVEKKFGVEIDPVIFVSKAFEGISSLERIKPLCKKEFYKPKKIKDYFQAKAQDYLRRKISKF